jgi:hypothetical protein
VDEAKFSSENVLGCVHLEDRGDGNNNKMGIREASCKFANFNLYSSPNIIRMIKSRRMRWAGHVAQMVEKRNSYRILVGMRGGKRPLGRPRRRLVDNIKKDLKEIKWDGIDWIDLAQNRDQWRALVNTVMNLRVP